MVARCYFSGVEVSLTGLKDCADQVDDADIVDISELEEVVE